jgi:hypothetical protein
MISHLTKIVQGILLGRYDRRHGDQDRERIDEECACETRVDWPSIFGRPRSSQKMDGYTADDYFLTMACIIVVGGGEIKLR